MIYIYPQCIYFYIIIQGHPSYAGAQKVLQYGELAAEEHVPGMEVSITFVCCALISLHVLFSSHMQLVDIASDPNEDSDVEFAASSGWLRRV